MKIKLAQSIIFSLTAIKIADLKLAASEFEKSFRGYFRSSENGPPDVGGIYHQDSSRRPLRKKRSRVTCACLSRKVPSLVAERDSEFVMQNSCVDITSRDSRALTHTSARCVCVRVDDKTRIATRRVISSLRVS